LNGIDILSDNRKIAVIGWLPVDYIELEEVILVSLAYFKKVIYGD
jgi:hypothetical protein